MEENDRSTAASRTTDRFRMAMSVLIATVTVMSAVIAWRASIAASAAGDADSEAVGAARRSQEARTVADVNAFEHYQAYVAWRRYARTGDLISERLAASPTPTAAEAERLRRELNEMRDISVAVDDFFLSRYFDQRDKSYDIEREQREAYADSARKRDLEPQPHVEQADDFRNRSTWLMGTIVVLAGSLLLFTVAYGAHPGTRVFVALGGGALLITAVTAAVSLETFIYG